MQKQSNMQDVFLNQARRDKVPVIVYLINGFQLKGLVKGFDSYVVMLESEGKQQLIYKHALSTIVPTKQIDILYSSSNDDKEDEPCPLIKENQPM